MATRTTSSRPSKTRQTKREPGFRDISEVKRSRAFAIYGKAGTGKTTLACSFPGPILLLDIQDEGTDSVSDVKNLKVWDISDPDEFEDAYWYLYENPKEFKTVILDTTTMLQHLKIMDLVGEKLKKTGKQAGDWGTMTKQDWGTVAAYMKHWITQFRNLKMNVIFLAQERVFNVGEEDTDIGVIDPEVGPSLSPSVKSHLNAAVSVIGNTFIRSRMVTKKNEKGKPEKKEKIEYCLGIGPSSVYTRKIRKPMSIELPDVLVDPTYDDIIELIEGD